MCWAVFNRTVKHILWKHGISFSASSSVVLASRLHIVCSIVGISLGTLPAFLFSRSNADNMKATGLPKELTNLWTRRVAYRDGESWSLLAATVPIRWRETAHIRQRKGFNNVASSVKMILRQHSGRELKALAVHWEGLRFETIRDFFVHSFPKGMTNCTVVWIPC